MGFDKSSLRTVVIFFHLCHLGDYVFSFAPNSPSALITSRSPFIYESASKHIRRRKNDSVFKHNISVSSSDGDMKMTIHVSSHPQQNLLCNATSNSKSNTLSTTPHQKIVKNKESTEKHRIRTMFKQAKELEKKGNWREACQKLEMILRIDPSDSYSHLALARLQSRRERSTYGELKKQSSDTTTTTDSAMSDDITPEIIAQSHPISLARQAFYNGINHCPKSVHLWQAWALHEESLGNVSFARALFQRALRIDEINPYVCHGYGLLEHRCGNYDLAQSLWERPLHAHREGTSTAALVCSLGKLLVAKGELKKTRDLYMKHVTRIKSEREASEVYLAAAWLEEKNFKNMNRAEELLKLALKISPQNSRAMAAIARLEGRRIDFDHKRNGKYKSIHSVHDIVERRDRAVRKRLQAACSKIMNEKLDSDEPSLQESEVRDGRLFNALAKIEVTHQQFHEARQTLQQGMALFPNDYSLFQAAGKLEERVGNITSARELYMSSLNLSISAPALVSYAMLETMHPSDKSFNYTKVSRLYEEALLLDPRHGPIYNAYGNMELKVGNIEKARQIYQNGVLANCRDVASVFHGLAMLELSLGNIETARLILRKGLREIRIQDSMMDTSRRKRAVFLVHSLGMLELNCDRAEEAKVIFETGIEQHGNSSQLLLGAALCDVKLGNEENARRLFEHSVKVDRKHAQAWQSWGVMEMRNGNYKVAKTLFECGIKHDPEHGALWQAYATMESRRGNFEVARALFAAGVRKCPDHVPLYQAWACLELRSEDFKKAKILITEALTRDKSTGSGWLVAAKIEEQLGNEGLKGLILRRGIECAPGSAQLYCALAEFEVSRGKFDIARTLLEKGLEIDPLHAPLYHSFAELEARVFNIEGLSTLNKRAAAVFSNNRNAVTSKDAIKILGNKLKKNSKSRRKLPSGVAALASLTSEDIDIEEIITDLTLDPDEIIRDLTISDDTIFMD